MNEGEGTVCKEDSRRLCRGCAGRAVCDLVRSQVSTGPFEHAMRSYSRRLCRGCEGRAVCHFVRNQVSTGPFEQAMRLYALVWVGGNGDCVVLAGSF